MVAPYEHQEYPKYLRSGANEAIVHSLEEEEAVLSDWTAPAEPIPTPAEADNALKRGPGRPRKVQSEEDVP